MTEKTKAYFLVTTEDELNSALLFIDASDVDADWVVFQLPDGDGWTMNFSRFPSVMQEEEHKQSQAFYEAMNGWIPDEVYASETAKNHEDYEKILRSVVEAQIASKPPKFERVL